MQLEQRFMDEAAAELRAADDAKFMARVRERARVLQQKSKDLETSDLRSPLERLAELEARRKVLEEAKRRAHPGCLSAAAGDELDRLPARISELVKACRMRGLLPRTAA